MKTLTLAIATLALVACAGQQQLTPEQAASYSNAAHTVIDNGLADYKAVQPILHR